MMIHTCSYTTSVYPKNYKAFGFLGWAHKELYQFKEAASAFQAAVKIVSADTSLKQFVKPMQKELNYCLEAI